MVGSYIIVERYHFNIFHSREGQYAKSWLSLYTYSFDMIRIIMRETVKTRITCMDTNPELAQLE